MAINPKASTKTKPGTKNTQKKGASKAKSKTSTGTKKAAPKARPAKRAVKSPSPAKKPSPKTTIKAVKPKTVVKPEKKAPDIEKEKKLTEASKAFEKKIDDMAQTAIQRSEPKQKKYSKAAIAVIIIVLAVLVYLLYPRNKTSVVEENIRPAPEPETELAVPETPAAEFDKDVTIYTVKIGDQLTEINKQFFGTYVGWKSIYEANRDKINDPNLIFPGQQLIIPKPE